MSAFVQQEARHLP